MKANSHVKRNVLDSNQKTYKKSSKNLQIIIKLGTNLVESFLD